MQFSLRPLAIAAGVALGVVGVSYALGHRNGRQRERHLNLSRFGKRTRTLLIFAPSRSDLRYQKQLRELAGCAAELQDRDVAELHILASGAGGSVVPSDASMLRTLLRIKRGQFRVVLLGKDGNVVVSETAPIAASELIECIDEMPVRRQELRRRAIVA